MHRPAHLAARVLLGAAASLLLLAAPAAAHETQNVDIGFAARAGDTPVTCGSPIPGLGSTAQTAQLTDLRFFVSGVALVRPDGRAVPVKPARDNAFRVTRKGGGVTLIDLENGKGACAEEGTAATNASVRGTAPHQSYVGVRFTIGVPYALNHTDAPGAPAPLNSAAMAWSWQFGRKFTKIEVSDPGGATGTWSAKTFMVHLGATGCVGNPATGQTVTCSAENRAQVRLTRFDPAKQRIAVDLQALFAGNDITVNREDAPGCMSGPTDPECAGVFRSLGIGWRADGGGNGASPTNAQTVFRAIAR